MKKLILFFALTGILSTLKAQHAFKNIIQVGASDEVGWDLMESANKSLLVGGYYTVVANSQWNSGLWYIDSTGNLSGSPFNYGSNPDNGTFRFKATADGGYVMVGYVASPSWPNYKMQIIKVNSDMTFAWEKVLPISTNNFDFSLPPEPLINVVEARDGNLIIATYDFVNSSNDFGFLAKYNITTGDTFWTKRYSHVDHTYQFHSLVVSPDSGYTAVGIANSRTNQNNNILLFHFDENGNKIWEQIIGGTNVNQRGNNILATNSGYIIAGKKLGSGWEALLLKTDLSGNALTSKTYYDGNTGYDDIFGLAKTLDGGYVISGYVQDGGKNGYVVKADSNLNKVWSKQYPNSTASILYSVISTSDGGYAMVGFTPTGVKWDLLIIKTDAVGNESSDNFPVPTVSTPSTVDPGSPCQFTSNIKFGTGTLTYKWTGAGGFTSILANPSFTYSTGGTYPYTLQVTDQNGAVGLFYGVVIVTTCNAPVVTSTVNNAACGLNNGTIVLDVSGGTSPYTYSWSNGAVTKDLSNLGAGTLTVTVTGSDACPTVKSVSVSKTQNPTVSLKTLTNPTTAVSNDGAIDINVAGGVQPYTYLWSDGQTIQDAINLTEGTYTVTITDSRGCTVTLQNTLVNLCGSLTVSGVISNPTSQGGSNGSVSLNVVGGTSPYTYIWNDGQIVQDPQNLKAGIYTVTVTDNKNCTVTSSYTLTDPVSVINPEKEGLFKVNLLPNPFSNSLQIRMNQKLNSGSVIVEIYSLTGKKLFSKTVDKGSESVKIDFTEALLPGSYIYKISSIGNNVSPAPVWGKLVKL